MRKGLHRLENPPGLDPMVATIDSVKIPDFIMPACIDRWARVVRGGFLNVSATAFTAPVTLR